MKLNNRNQLRAIEYIQWHQISLNQYNLTPDQHGFKIFSSKSWIWGLRHKHDQSKYSFLNSPFNFVTLSRHGYWWKWKNGMAW